MRHINLLHFRKLALSTLLLAVMLFSQSAFAATVTVDFDSLNASGGTITGAPVTNYLSGYGMTASNLTPGSNLYIGDYSGVPYAVVPSGSNVFTLMGPDANGDSFTLNFSNSVSDFSLTRMGFRGYPYSPSGNALGDWSATAYDASHVALGTIGEPMIASYADIPMQTFTLGYQGISSIAFYGNAHNWAGVQMPWMDNLTFTTIETPVPEPETYAMLLVGLGLLGLMAYRRKYFTV